MPGQTRHFYDFGPFRLDSNRRRLTQNGEPVALPPKAMEALLVLVKNKGKLLERESLMEAVWADTFVEDANLTVAISQLRKVLGQNGETAEYIETIPRVGYRFVGNVRESFESTVPVIVEKHTRSQTIIEEEIVSDPPVEKAKRSNQTRIAGLLSRQSFPRYKTPLFVSMIAIVAVGISGFLRFRTDEKNSLAATTREPHQIRSLAVLPPRTLNKGEEDTALSLGMADALITRLAGLRRLTVRPTSAIARYVSRNAVSTDVGRALSVDAVLEGTLQRQGGRARLTLHLVDVVSGGELWAGTVEEPDTDIFKLQDSASEKVAEVLTLNLTQDEKSRLRQRQTFNPEAYANYLKGCYFWSKRGVEVTKSLDYFRKAIALDPTFAEAYTVLASADAMGAIPSPEAEVLIAKALQLDDSLAEAHATYGFIRMFHHWDWEGARQELDRALALDPNSQVAHHWKGVYFSLIGNLHAAKAEMLRGLELDPLSLIINADLGQVYYFSHDYDQALAYCNRALALDPQFEMAHMYLFDIYRMKGMNDEALRHLAIAENPDADPQTQKRAQESYASMGLEKFLRTRLQLFQHYPDPKVTATKAAQFYAILGEPEEALRWLEASPERPNFIIPYSNVDPIFDSLHGNPRYEAVMQRMSLRSQTTR